MSALATPTRGQIAEHPELARRLPAGPAKGPGVRPSSPLDTPRSVLTGDALLLVVGGATKPEGQADRASREGGAGVRLTATWIREVGVPRVVPSGPPRRKRFDASRRI